MRSRKIHLTIDPASCIIWALMLLVLPFSWLLAAAAAALVHELGHLVGIWLFAGTCREITVQPDGMVIHADIPGRGRELLCILLGPLFGAALLIFAHRFPQTAVCAGLQTLYNLLPIYPLDGGRALHCAASMLFSPIVSARICRWVNGVTLAALLLAAGFAAVWLDLGVLPLVVSGTLAVRSAFRNTTCKEGAQNVQ